MQTYAALCKNYKRSQITQTRWEQVILKHSKLCASNRLSESWPHPFRVGIQVDTTASMDTEPPPTVVDMHTLNFLPSELCPTTVFTPAMVIVPPPPIMWYPSVVAHPG